MLPVALLKNEPIDNNFSESTLSTSTPYFPLSTKTSNDSFALLYSTILPVSVL